MFEAEQFGKRILYDSEDNLTSRVFGLLRYIDHKIVLIPALLKAISIVTNKLFPIELLLSATKVDYFFWPKSEIGEPDLCIIFECPNMDYLLAIEVKLKSGKSGFGEEHDQLKRYYTGLSDSASRRKFNEHKIATFKGEFLGIIYLTVDPALEELKESYELLKNDYEQVYLYMLTWRGLHESICSALKQEKSEWYSPYLADLLKLLEILNLRHFDGWENIECDKTLVTNFPIFYYTKKISKPESYDWVSICPLGFYQQKGVLFYGNHN
jgi:hypothetical protein